MTTKRKIPAGISVLSLRLSEQHHEELRRVAEREQRTVSQEARLAIVRHLQAQEKVA